MTIAEIIAEQAREVPLRSTLDASRVDFCLYGLSAVKATVCLHGGYTRILAELHAIEDGLTIITNRHAAAGKQ